MLSAGETFDAALSGYRVLVTRPAHQARELVEALGALGATAVVSPLIDIVAPEDTTGLDTALRDGDRFDYTVFTSANAARAVVERRKQLGLGVKPCTGGRIIAVGKATARQLAQSGFRAVDIPSGGSADAVLSYMAACERGRVLLPQADIAEDGLGKGLATLGFDVLRVTAYRTVVRHDEAARAASLAAGGSVDAVMLTSPSAAVALLDALSEHGHQPPGGCVLVCIGRSTGEALASRGIRVAAVAVEPSTTGLIDALVAALRANEGGRATPTL